MFASETSYEHFTSALESLLTGGKLKFAYVDVRKQSFDQTIFILHVISRCIDPEAHRA